MKHFFIGVYTDDQTLQSINNLLTFIHELEFLTPLNPQKRVRAQPQDYQAAIRTLTISMTFFHLHNAIEAEDNQSLGMQDIGGLLSVLLKQKAQFWPSFELSAIDQAFLIWAGITLVIFLTGQFSSVSWAMQTVIDAALTGVGIASTSRLNWALVGDERLNWVIALWAVLMTAGMCVSAYGIYACESLIMVNLCPLWMGLCALGYGAMAVGMRSHAFTAACLVHTLAIALLHHQPNWQYLTTGLVISSTLVFFSVVPWDMQVEEAMQSVEDMQGMEDMYGVEANML